MLEPLTSNVFVWPYPAPTEVNGIHVAPGAIPKPQRGVVWLVGPGMWIPGGPNGVTRTPIDVKKGQIVLYSQAASWEIETDGVTYRVFNGMQGLIAVDGEVEADWEPPKDKPQDAPLGLGRREILRPINIHV